MNDLAVVEEPPEWDRLKQMVLDSVSLPITKRIYNMALDEFHRAARARIAFSRNHLYPPFQFLQLH